jgi:hypothetical protein
VTGTVEAVIPRNDGDYQVDLRVDRCEEELRNSVNVADANDELVTEIVPSDQASCVPGQPVREDTPFDVGSCAGADVSIPEVGERVSVSVPTFLREQSRSSRRPSIRW